MTKVKLIVLLGFAASGKTTIADKYIADHDLALALDVDVLVTKMGNWHKYRDEVRNLSFELVKSILRTYLQTGNDVVLPYYVLSATDLQAFESIAQECGADYYEIILHNEHQEAVRRLLNRGAWGEANSPIIAEEDLPTIQAELDKMEAVFNQRSNATKILVTNQTPDETYAEVLALTQI